MAEREHVLVLTTGAVESAPRGNVVLFAQRIRDLEALLHGAGVHGIDVIDLDRDAGGGHVARPRPHTILSNQND